MSKVPGCQPDGPAIRALIRDRGCSVPEFARSIGRNPRTIWGILSNGDRASVTSIRQIARGLGVKPRDISDFKGGDSMSVIPTGQPDPQKIRALIWERGYSQAGFARKIGRPPRTLYALLNDKPVHPVSIALIRQIARGLKVKPGEISDWTGDDDNESEPETPDRMSA